MLPMVSLLRDADSCGEDLRGTVSASLRRSKEKFGFTHSSHGLNWA